MRLVELNLDRCSAITEEGVQALYRSLADLGHSRFHLRLPQVYMYVAVAVAVAASVSVSVSVSVAVAVSVSVCS
jgi:predicted transcriptional regulator